MENKIIDIVLSTDNNYIAHTATLVCSICENNSASVKIHILIYEVSCTNMDRLVSLKNTHKNLEIFFYPFNDRFILDRLGVLRADRSLSAFARIFIPETLPSNIHRAIYLDVDGLVLSSLDSLFNVEFDNYALAGVLDTNPISRHYAVGLTKDDIYINSGMFVMNIDFFRKNQLVEQLVDFIKSKEGRIDAMDQGTINGVLSRLNLIKVIEPKYNVLTAFFQLNAEQIKLYYGCNTYQQHELDIAIKNPVFVHFTPNLTSRPWCKHCKHPLKNEYWYYRNLAKWPGKIEKDRRSFKIRFLSLLFYYLPFRFFLGIINIRNTKKMS
jgi:lipopolysaccharide biosynthesis glycosyltransferase